MTIVDFIAKLRDILNTATPFIIGLAVFVIIWGIFNYIAHAAEEEKRAEARQFIVWGIIGVFFMISIWGFVNILLGTFSLETVIDPADIPKVPTLQ